MEKGGDFAEEVLRQPERVVRRATRTLGKHVTAVRQFVRHANRIHWMERAGLPEPWDAEVVRVWELERAKAVDEAFAPMLQAAWQAVDGIGNAAGRGDLMLAAEDYWIVRFDPWPRDRRSPAGTVAAPVDTALVGALRELVLDDVTSIRFFREIVDWYERGHWLCGIDAEGRRIVW